MKIDMHVHSKYSRDSSINYNQIKKCKMDYICLTDHDSYNWDKFKGLNIIKGVEKTIIEENGNKFHLLIYFLNEKIKSNNFNEVMDEVKQQDAYTSLAHPYDFLRKAPKNPEMYCKRVDAIETINSRIIIPFSNSKAKKLAIKHNLNQTAGSDAHHYTEMGNAYVECASNEIEDLRKKLKVKGHSSLPHVHLFSFLSKHNLLK